ncbi:hypothetical protein [Alistipes onderdonkii]|nr:hypothetical protein [Alistipes onderdonkii]
MTSTDRIDQRERKKQQGQAAAFYSSSCRQQDRSTQMQGQQVSGSGIRG